MIGYVPRKMPTVANVAPFDDLIGLYCEKKGITKDQLRSKNPKTRMPIRRISGLRLDEMRRCLSLHFFLTSELSTPQIAKLVGCNHHTTILSQIAQARGLKETKDEIFMGYYGDLLECVGKLVQSPSIK